MVAALMELRHLRSFVAVAEEQNITRAAARLHVSQPPLSRQISMLEDELGVQLLERTARSIHLTQAGQLFLEEARAVLKRADDAVQAVRAAAMEKAALNVGYAPSPTVEILPVVLRAFQKEAPRVRVILHDMTGGEMLAGLRAGTLDAALTVQPAAKVARGLVFEKLRAYRMGVVVPPGHPFARRKSVDIRDVLAAPLVVFSQKDYPDYHQGIMAMPGVGKRSLRIAEECDGITSLIAAVESGRGVALALEVVNCIAGQRLKFIPVTPKPQPTIIGIACRKSGASALARQFVQIACVSVERGRFPDRPN
jgi:DNA-binding transcriptional LysR family regulator